MGQVDPCGGGVRRHAGMRFYREWSDEDPRFLALCRDLELNGAYLPVFMTRKLEVCDFDGWNRCRAARRLQLERIPVAWVEEEQMATVLLGGLLQREHLTKSARAYLAYPLMERAFVEAREKRIKNIKKGNVSRSCTECTIGSKVEDFAEEIGIGRRLFFMAKQVHEIFVRDAGYKGEMEPRILQEAVGGEHEGNRPVGLGAVIAGWAGRGATADRARGGSEQLELFLGGFSMLGKRFRYWEGFTAEEKRLAAEGLERELEGAPAELLEVLGRAARRVKV